MGLSGEKAARDGNLSRPDWGEFSRIFRGSEIKKNLGRGGDGFVPPFPDPRKFSPKILKLKVNGTK